MFYIYTIQNKVNNKLYVGWTSNYEERWRSEKGAAFNIKHGDHNNLLSRAFRKYAKNRDDIENHFIFQIIEEFCNDEKNESHLSECYYIEFFRTNINRFGKNAGYNMTDGGELGSFGFRHTQETKDKISKVKKGKPAYVFTDEEKKNISEKISKKQKGNGKKITQDIANNIRVDYKTGNYSQISLCKKYKISPSVVADIINNNMWTDEKYALTKVEVDKIINENYDKRDLSKPRKNPKISKLIIDDIRFEFMNNLSDLSITEASNILLEKYKDMKPDYMYKIISNLDRITDDFEYINFIKNKKRKLKINQILADKLRNDFDLMSENRKNKIDILSKKYNISIRYVYGIINNEYFGKK